MGAEGGRRRRLLLAGAIVALVVATLLLPRIPQDPRYHAFADTRAFLGVPNAGNVLSNLPLLLVGLAGLRRTARGGGARVAAAPAARRAWRVFFAGVALTAVGSAYYHWAPDDARLVWDRLPMTIAFMGVVGAVLAERVSPELGGRALAPLLVLGAATVVYWQVTEAAGRGDLRPYVAVQFGPMLLLPLVFLLYPSRYTRGGDFATALLVYGAGKALEVLDGAVLRLGGIVSGHTLKHLLAAVAAAGLLRMITRRGLTGERDVVTVTSAASGAERPDGSPRSAHA